ncbi:MAG: DNA mismatch repair protein MutS [Syntrophomonadaceae bacterium]|nr:DNA mismatch repair protein MutS [Syntrophomonadaceae bacterium]
MNDTRQMFLQRRQAFTANQEKTERYSNRLSNLRLVFFLTAGFVTVLLFLYADRIYGYLSLSLALVLFIALLVLHDRVIKRADYYSRMAKINQQCLQRMTGAWVGFSDHGQEYQNPGHRYSNDLDIFGPASLFQWINTTNTYHGREYLRKLLENPDRDKKNIRKRQNAIRELASNLELCQALQGEAMDSRDYMNNPEKLFAYAEDNKRLFSHKWSAYIFYILPLITLMAIIISSINPSFFWYVPLALVFIQIIINFWGSKQVNNILVTIYDYKRKVEVYQRFLELLEKQKFADAYLLELKADLVNDELTASQQLKGLDKIVGAVAFQYNPIIYFIVNNLFFWDFHCVFALEKWKARSGLSLRKWVNNLGIYEALASMAMISQLNPEWCFPEFDQDQLFFAAEEMGHPLITGQQRVTNNLTIENQIAVITGSNMSGKTTLLRTIGVNLVLAYAGAPVCARKFGCSIMEIYTSMRISDDLNSGISTFYAELLRIKMIIDFSKNEQDMIFLIDEVFRGTNSLDRVTGARNVLLNLNKPWAIGLISTHDYELCELEHDHSGRIKNYHFIESYHENEIRFDYRLKPGSCKTSNAKYLMKMVGIEILD